MTWRKVKLGDVLTESRILCGSPNANKRIRVKLNVAGVEKRPLENEIEGATKQFIRNAGQFIYGKQNFHKGAFGVIPKELDGFETSADIPSFDLREDCLAGWIYYFFKIRSRYKALESLARGVGSKRVHPEQIFPLEVPLPSIAVQAQLIQKFQTLESISSQITAEQAHQLELVRQLRQAFLREAMQGQLVEQDAADEPAAILLGKIKAEKERLIAGKKLRKDKPLPEIKADEIPFEIPDNWTWCRLGEIVEMTRGRFSIRPRNDPRYFGGKYPFIQIGSLDDKGSIITEYSQTLNESGYKVSKYFPQGTIAVAIVGGTIGNLGVLGIDMCFTDSMVGITPNHNYNQMFVLAFLRFKQSAIRAESYQMSGQPNIKIPTLANLLLPLPPLAEQQRIVEKLEKLMAFCDALEATIREGKAHAISLLQVALKEALDGAQYNEAANQITT